MQEPVEIPWSTAALVMRNPSMNHRFPIPMPDNWNVDPLVFFDVFGSLLPFELPAGVIAAIPVELENQDVTDIIKTLAKVDMMVKSKRLESRMKYIVMQEADLSDSMKQGNYDNFLAILNQGFQVDYSSKYYLWNSCLTRLKLYDGNHQAVRYMHDDKYFKSKPFFLDGVIQCTLASGQIDWDVMRNIQRNYFQASMALGPGVNPPALMTLRLLKEMTETFPTEIPANESISKPASLQLSLFAHWYAYMRELQLPTNPERASEINMRNVIRQVFNERVVEFPELEDFPFSEVDYFFGTQDEFLNGVRCQRTPNTSKLNAFEILAVESVYPDMRTLMDDNDNFLVLGHIDLNEFDRITTLEGMYDHEDFEEKIREFFIEIQEFKFREFHYIMPMKKISYVDDESALFNYLIEQATEHVAFKTLKDMDPNEDDPTIHYNVHLPLFQYHALFFENMWSPIFEVGFSRACCYYLFSLNGRYFMKIEWFQRLVENPFNLGIQYNFPAIEPVVHGMILAPLH